MGGTRVANVRKSVDTIEVIRGVSLGIPDGSLTIFFSLRSPSSGPWQVDTHVISGGEVGGIVPPLAKPTRRALWTPADGQAEPRLVAPAYARRAREMGATVAEGCGVVAVETAGGRVVGGRTAAGAIRAETVIVAAGVSSTAVLTINK